MDLLAASVTVSVCTVRNNKSLVAVSFRFVSLCRQLLEYEYVCVCVCMHEHRYVDKCSSLCESGQCLV